MRDGLRGQRVVTRDHDRLDAHAAQFVEPLPHALLDDVLEVDDAQDPGALLVLDGDQQRRAAGLGDPVGEEVRVGRDLAALLLDPGDDRTGSALAGLAAVDVHARHAGLGGEGDPLGLGELALVALAQPVLFLREDHDGAALGGLVGQRRQLRGIGQFGFRRSLDRDELGGLAVAERDRARLVEQQRGNVAGGLDRTPRHREDVALDEPVHAGDADGGEQRADGRRDEAHEQSGEHDHRLLGVCVDRERLQGDHGQQEDDGEGREQDVEGDLVRRLLPGRTLDQGDHPVDEGLAGLGRDLDDDPVREDLRAAGDGRAVAARFADDGRGLAGDGGLVDRGDAFDDVTVARDDVAGLADHEVADPQVGAGYPLLVRADQAAGDGVRLRLAQGVGLGLAAALGDCLRQVGEDRGQPQPCRDRPAEPVRRVLDRQHGGDHRPHEDHEHDRRLDHDARVELPHRVGEGLEQGLRVEETAADAPCRGLVPGGQVFVRSTGGGDGAHEASPSASGPSARAGK